VRANVADRADPKLIPGDVFQKHKRGALARLPGPIEANEEQLIEDLYYQPCSVCGLAWGDPACRCASGA
jgi:molecular chaperone DnaK